MAIEKTIILNVESDGAIKSIEKVDDSIQGVTNTTEDLNKELKKTGKIADKSMDGLDKGAKKGTKAVSRLSGGFKKLGVAIKASGIGLLVSGIAAFGSVASKNQGVMDSLSTTMTVVQLLFNDILSGGKRLREEGFGFFSSILKEARSFTEQLKAVALAQALITRETLQSEIAAEKERQTRDDVTKSFEDRISASKRLRIVIDEQAETTKKLALETLAAAENAFLLNDSNENAIAVVDATTQVLEAENKAVTALSEQLVSHNGLIKEQTDLQQQNTDSVNDNTFARDRALAALEGDGIRRLEALQAINDSETELLQAKLFKIHELEGISDEEKIARLIETQARIDEINIDGLGLQRDIAFARLDLQSDIVTGAGNALKSLTSIAGAETDLGKGLLIASQLAAAAEIAIGISKLQFKAKSVIAEATMDGAKATTSVATGAAVTLSAGFPAAIPLLIGYAVAAAGIVGSIISATKNSKKIGSQFGASGGSIETPTVPTAPPSFNIVGTAPENQLANTISTAQQVPVQAFVVASEVTSQQSLDRNKVDTASFG